MGNIKNRFNIFIIEFLKYNIFLLKGNTFGPFMLIWFSSLFSIGIWRTRLKPRILRSFNPYEAIHYLIREKKAGFYHIGLFTF